MIQAHIEKNLHHEFQLDDKYGLHMIFVSQDMLGTGKVFNPHWAREFANRASREAVCRWTSHRRDQWQAWGELAEAIGRDAFYKHMEQMMAAEPPELVAGNVVHRCDDDTDVILGEMLHGRQGGTRIEGLHRHRFADAATRDRFYDWLYAGDIQLLSKCLINMIYAEGTAAVSEAIDGALANWKPKRSGRGRGGKTGRSNGNRPLGSSLPTQVFVRVPAAA